MIKFTCAAVNATSAPIAIMYSAEEPLNCNSVFAGVQLIDRVGKEFSNTG